MKIPGDLLKEHVPEIISGHSYKPYPDQLTFQPEKTVRIVWNSREVVGHWRGNVQSKILSK